MEHGHGKRQMETELRGRPIRMNRCQSGSQREQLGRDIKYTPSIPPAQNVSSIKGGLNEYIKKKKILSATQLIMVITVQERRQQF
jgi:hypothetical protein